MNLQKLFVLLIMSFVSMSVYGQRDSSAVRPFNSAIKVRVAEEETLLTREVVKREQAASKQGLSSTPKPASMPSTLPIGNSNMALFGSDTVSVKPLRRKD